MSEELKHRKKQNVIEANKFIGHGEISHFTIQSRGIMMKHIDIVVKYTFIAIIFASFMFAFAESNETAQGNIISPIGTYAAKLPSASGMGRIAIIHLFANGNAMRTNIYIGKPKSDYIENGVWEMKGKTLIVTLTIEKDNAGIEKKKVLKFKLEGNNLISTQYDEKPFGESEIKFTKISEVNLK
ncbi:MAG: copper resistance protein NlpE N-terminal domain-containing protein [Candidatus Desulfofervidaceae bacterium]|nr:copper resistance protein NlpE N-terminal domain-containing protein [Candidatus Desulfofervidaceae bacterium]